MHNHASIRKTVDLGLVGKKQDSRDAVGCGFDMTLARRLLPFAGGG
jgi:hypothetical protein